MDAHMPNLSWIRQQHQTKNCHGNVTEWVGTLCEVYCEILKIMEDYYNNPVWLMVIHFLEWACPFSWSLM